jgi:YVTN family beta-propeller protein
VGDLPLNVVQSPDSRYLVVTNNGLSQASLMVVDIAAWAVKSTTPLAGAWYGLAWHPDGTKLYAGEADHNTVQEFAYANGVLTPQRAFPLPTSGLGTFAGGLAVSPDGKTLYVTQVFAQTVSSIDLASGRILQTVSLPAEPYTCLVSADGKTLYVSLWGGARVQVFDTRLLMLKEELQTDEHPNALLLSADGTRLFIACATAATVWVYDTFAGLPIEQISTRLFPNAPPTAGPNSLSLSPDGRTMLVANADDNDVAVVDVRNSAQSLVDGFIPAGWYPTGAIFSHDGKQMFVLSGKGSSSQPNSTGIGAVQRLLGTVSAVPVPGRMELERYTRQARSLTPYSDAILMAPASVPVGSPIPQVVGGSSPIKHVFYVIRENRTFDQVLGDLPQGNGDPPLAIFGSQVTPNAHALAQTFVLLDNFYVNAEVSEDGHAYAMGAVATDFVQKLWQTYYSGRGGIYLSEGGGFMRNPYGNITAPEQGYIWDAAQRASVSVRSYGEFADNVSKTSNGGVAVAASVPGLSGLVAPSFAAFDLSIPDGQRVDAWLQEFGSYVQNGNLPQLSIVRLGNDHTNGTVPGTPTPRAMVAENDYALGRLVEAISNSVYWKDSAIFVIEDDSQNGTDHVDAHRSVLLVASPFAQRTAVDHTFYTTVGVLRTIELILGLPPLSEYDAAATPVYNAFQSTPNLAPFARVPPQIPLSEVNQPSAYGAAQSRAMDFSDADRAPEQALNEIVWRSVRGAGSVMPPPRRTAFVR